MSNLLQTNNSENNLTLLAQKVDNTYREGLSIYTESIANYTLEIEGLRSQIETEKKLIEPLESKLLGIEREKEHEERSLNKLHDIFTQKLHSIDELRTEYVDLMDTDAYEKVLSKKQSELQLALDEFEESEITLLKQELEHINLLTSLTPKQHQIAELEESLKKLILQKEYYALKNLQQLPQLALDAPEEITTEIIEEHKVEETKS